jgi:putative endonuclease
MAISPATPSTSTFSSKMPWWRRWFGTRSERAAARFLRRQGFRILARNLHSSRGELDLVALDLGCIVFVEVRSTGRPDLEGPAISVDAAKQRRLTELALQYLQRRRLLGRAARFDVVVLSWPEGQRSPTVVHHRNAFEAIGRFQLDS